MIITAFFTNSGTPATGLSPIIRIRDLFDNSLLITDAAMSEVGDGTYKYDFLTYDKDKEYSIRCDGGVILTGGERYTYGGNENYIEDIGDTITETTSAGFESLDLSISQVAGNVWEEELADHNLAGTFGGELATKADLSASTSTTETTATTASDIFGTPTGTYINTFIRDNIYWQIQESVVNGITVEFTFNIPNDDRAGVIRSFGRYIGQPTTTHYMELWSYNYESLAWELLQEVYMPGGSLSDAEYEHEYYERNIDRTNNNEIRVRLIHHISGYNSGHTLYLDYITATSVAVITAKDIAAAVWSEPTSGYSIDGTFGSAINRMVGMMHENIYIDNPVYDSDCNMTSARVRIYSNAVSVGTVNDIIGTYEITAPASGPGKFVTWQQIKV